MVWEDEADAFNVAGDVKKESSSSSSFSSSSSSKLELRIPNARELRADATDEDDDVVDTSTTDGVE